LVVSGEFVLFREEVSTTILHVGKDVSLRAPVGCVLEIKHVAGRLSRALVNLFFLPQIYPPSLPANRPHQEIGCKLSIPQRFSRVILLNGCLKSSLLLKHLYFLNLTWLMDLPGSLLEWRAPSSFVTSGNNGARIKTLGFGSYASPNSSPSHSMTAVLNALGSLC
jgi:hypothetical protein